MTKSRGKAAIIDAVYAIWEEWGRIDDYPTELDAALILERLRTHEPTRGYIRWHGSEKAHQDVVTWLTDREEWSPVVDDVAVSRAIRSLSRKDYLQLTLREKNSFSDRLSRMHNPFDWPGKGVPEVTDRGIRFRTEWDPADARALSMLISKARAKREIGAK